MSTSMEGDDAHSYIPILVYRVIYLVNRISYLWSRTSWQSCAFPIKRLLIVFVALASSYLFRISAGNAKGNIQIIILVKHTLYRHTYTHINTNTHTYRPPYWYSKNSYKSTGLLFLQACSMHCLNSFASSSSCLTVSISQQSTRRHSSPQQRPHTTRQPKRYKRGIREGRKENGYNEVS